MKILVIIAAVLIGVTLFALYVWYVSKQRDPVSAFQIADAIAGKRWSSDTVRSCVSRAGLHAVDAAGVTPRNRRCLRYVLQDGAA